MVKYQLSSFSLSNLQDVHCDLQSVVNRAIKITTIDFTVIEGVRTKERQKKLVERGASQTLNSRHLTGHAVDLVPWVDGGLSWHWSDFDPLAAAMKEAAEEQMVPITWGGEWQNFPDGAHFQLSWEDYPK